MASLVKPWLWPGIEKEVRQRLPWKAGSQSTSPSVNDALPYEDDDSNLRIQSMQVGKIVQIIKFLTFDDPIQAVISDKKTYITTTIASTASEQFSRKYGKRITENTRGCLVQLQQFEIVATHHGPQADRLTLRIQELKHIGCDGEGTFGNPQPIIQQDGLQQFLNELKAFRVQESANRAAARNRHHENSFPSQESNSEGERFENKVVDSQLVFATQHSNFKSAKARSWPAHKEGKVLKKDISNVTEIPNKNADLKSYCTSLEEVKQDLLTRPTLSEIECTHHSTTASVPSITPQGYERKPFSASELLALLKRDSGKNVDKPVVPKENIEARTLKPSVTSSNLPKEQDVPEVQEGETREIGTLLDCPTVSAQSPLKMSSIQQVVHQDVTTEAARLESPETIQRSIPTSHVGIHSDTIISRDKDCLSLLSPLNVTVSNMEKVEDPWYGHSRIRRKDVTIPKNQQILLNRKDCWLPPEPGSRGPVANIPVSILQSFTAMVERPVAVTPTSANVQQDDCDSLSDTSELSMSQHNVLGPQDSTLEDDELSISTGEWPASSPLATPKVDQLPPDSSFEVTLDHMKKDGRRGSRTSEHSTPSPNERGSVARNQNTPEIDSGVMFTSQGNTKQLVSKCYKSQKTHKRNSTREMNIPHSNSDFDDNFEDSSETEVEMTHHKVSCEKRFTNAADIENKSDNNKSNKDAYHIDIDIDTIIHNEHGSPGRLPPAEADEEIFSQQQASMDHSRPGSDHHGEAPLGDITHPSEASNVLTSDKDSDFACSSSSELETAIPNALCEGVVKALVKQRRSTPMNLSDSRKSTLQVHRTPYLNQDYRVKKETIQRDFPVQHPAYGPQDTDTLKRQYSMSDDDSVMQDIIPGTYSQMNSAQKPAVDHFRVFHTGDAGVEVPAFHDRWTPGLNEEAAIGSRKPFMGQPALNSSADPERVNKRGPEESAITLENVTKRRKRTKVPEVFMIENDRPIEDPSIRARQQRREFLNQLKAQSRNSTLSLNSVQGDSNNAGIAKPPAEPVLPLHTQCNRGLSASQGSSKTKTTCTRTPEATSSRSGTPQKEVQAIELGNDSQIKIESMSLIQNSPKTLSSDVVVQSIFLRFQDTYPTYQGNEKHFAAMCRKIDVLETGRRMEHRSLWDDFIIRHQTEYREYLLECSEQADDPMAYENFYRARIDEPLFNKRIITPGNLREAISQSLQNGGRPVASTETPKRGSGVCARGVCEVQDNVKEHAPKVSEIGVLSTRDIPSQHNPPLQHYSPLQQDLPQPRKSPPQPRLPSQQSNSPRTASLSSPILGTPRSVQKTPRSLPWKRKSLDEPSPSSGRSKQRIVSSNVKSSAGTPTGTSPTIKAVAIPSNWTPQGARDGMDVAFALEPQPSSLRPTSTPRRPIAPLSQKTVRPSRQPLAATAEPWYLDPVNPFKSFARADASLRSGNGNGFVDGKSKQQVKEARAVVENGIVMTRLRDIDILAWEL